MNPESQVRKEALRVIPRAVRLPNSYRHSSGQSGEEQSAFHLRAGDWTRVRQSTQPASTNRERQAVAFFLYIGAHLLQRLSDTAHGTTPQRTISGERRRERLTGQYPEHEAGGRA